MRPVIARERISIAFRSEAEFLCRIGCEARHNHHQAAGKQEGVPETAQKFVHVNTTGHEMLYALRALISCFD